MKYSISLMIAVCLVVIMSCTQVFAGNNFYAYHTKVQHSATDYLGKYADLIVVLGENRQLEFTRRTGYLPLWKTESGSYLMDDFYPGRDKDYVFYYNYVRLMENTPDKIVIHWRYIPDIQTLNKANENKDPINLHGFLGVVHELFTIYPDGRVERSIKDAKGTTIKEWNNPSHAITQTLQLQADGIDYGPVDWGRPFDDENAAATEFVKNDTYVIDTEGLATPLREWTFDEGLYDFGGAVIEKITDTESSIEGLNVLFKKGVSGTAVAFDGYTTGIEMKFNNPEFYWNMTLEAWIALDVYPYNDAPVVHQSENFGEKGYYFGIDPYGRLLFRLNGTEIKSPVKLPLYKWQHVAVTVGYGKITLYINGAASGSSDYNKSIGMADALTTIGINSEKSRCSDYVRTPQQNLPFIFGIQGMIDEVRIYDKRLSADQINSNYRRFLPKDVTSPVKPGVLPGEIRIADKFGAYYDNLKVQELWDNMWRMLNDDVVVKFDNMPTSVIFWRGSNYAANWITDGNQWMSDQSSEIWGTHGCSEHMADKQVRHSYARIIENTPARVMIHWRYPCVDVGYICESKINWTDEYHTIYPDGTGIRKVHWNKKNDPEAPGFQDIQFFTNPGETVLDVVDLQALDVANIEGDVEKLQWAKPNVIPEITIENATIELIKSKSNYKIFVIFQGGNITPWGANEQSAYTDDPFAGPWNHWPMHLVPSDGRFAVDYDRVAYFALSANDLAPAFGSMVYYGFTKEAIDDIIPNARYWQNPPAVTKIIGAESKGFFKDEKAYQFVAKENDISFTIDADDDSPVINPAFVIYNWPVDSDAVVTIDEDEVVPGPDFRQGISRDTEGNMMKIIWLRLDEDSEMEFTISVK
jgi:hypothetical protein